MEENFSKNVIAWCAVGLGNKICTLLGALYWSQQLNRNFQILWVSDNHCKCNYFDIFNSYLENNISSVDYSDTIAACNNSFPCKETLNTFINTPSERDIKTHYMKLYLNTIKRKLAATNITSNLAKIDQYRNLVYQNSILPPEIDILKALELISLFKINKDLLEQVDQFLKKHNIDYNVQGIAIRKTDVPLETHELTYHKLVTQNPTKRFFITSDDTEIKKTFKKYDNVITYENFSYNLWDGQNIYRDKDAVITAFIEMLILAHTNLYRLVDDIKSTFYFCTLIYNLHYTGITQEKINAAELYKQQLLEVYIKERG